MKRRLMLPAIAGFMLLASSVMASWMPTTMASTLPGSGTLSITPSWEFNGSHYIYNYSVTNNTNADIVAFSMTFPDITDLFDSITVLCPDGWSWGEGPAGLDRIHWSTHDDVSMIATGASVVFGYESTLSPGLNPDMRVAATGDASYSGITYGPAVPEPSSMAGLAAGLIGALGMWKTRRV